MIIQFNGERRHINQPLPLGKVLQIHAIEPGTPGVAVALNEQIILRHKWDLTILKEGDRIEVVHAAQGG